MDDIPLFPGVDKVVHFCMYGGMSGMLWLEFLRNHRKYETVLWHGAYDGNLKVLTMPIVRMLE